MFLSYTEFIRESAENRIFQAEKVARDPQLAKILNDCEEGKHVHVALNVTPGADSYVGVAINDGTSTSEVYKTSDPKVALIAIIMKNTSRTSPEEIASILKTKDDFLNYTVFAGDRAMTQEEVAKKYNSEFKISPGVASQFFTSTPIKKETN